jgi:hypothetical protein
VRKKALYGLFLLSVLLFIAKPFIGFAASAKREHVTASNILIKSFDKRKPEDFHDAEQKKATIRQMLTEPPLNLLVPISLLLGFIFPLIFEPTQRISDGFLSSIKYSLIPASQPYLLTGKLSI